MKPSFKERVLDWGVPLALGCVLVALAVLQYRWSGEISDAASTRMKASLDSAVMNFRQDLSRELGNIALNMQVESDGQTLDDRRRIAQNFARWQQTTSHSGLVANVFLWNGPGKDSDQLLRLIQSENRFEPTKWPASFAKLHIRLDKLSAGLEFSNLPRQESSLRLPPKAGHGGSPEHVGPYFFAPDPSHSERVWQIDQHIPVLAHSFDWSGTSAAGPKIENTAWLLIELSPPVLQKSVLPNLSARYFGDARSGDYEVAVVNAGALNAPFLYSSGGDTEKLYNGHADASLNLFGPPGIPFGPPGSGMGFSRPFPGRPPDSHGPDWFGPVRLDPLYYSADDHGWMLLVRHRMGSVEAAVAGLRRRNLVFSFGVLMVLAATMGLILFNSHRARRLARMQMEFVAGVSHELRTPIAVISSAAENITDGVVDNPEKLARYGGVIHRQAQQLNHLVEQVLRFAAKPKNNSNHAVRPVEVQDAIETALENTAGISVGFHIERRIDPQLPAVLADFGGLTQCLQNLISNAVKYSGDSKWIGIKAATPGQSPAGRVRITVEDHGIGIEGDEIKRIFDPFYRGSTVASTNIHGTGLGLALARQFAEAMGGDLTVQSEIGKGTCFTLELPAADATDSESDSEANAAPGATSGRKDL